MPRIITCFFTSNEVSTNVFYWKNKEYIGISGFFWPNVYGTLNKQ